MKCLNEQSFKVLNLPILCAILLFISVFLGVRIVKIRQNIIIIGREISYIEKRCESLANKNIELHAKIVALNSMPPINDYNLKDFTIPHKDQIVRATSSDIRDFAKNGTRHFANKQKINTAVSMNKIK